MFKRISDTVIIEGIRNQDDVILNWLYDNYFASIKKHVLNNSGTNEDVSDVFQDTIIVLYRQITENSLDLTSDLKGYFFGIARNIWNTELRKKLRMNVLEADFHEETANEDDSQDVVLERVLSRAFSKLKPDMQTVLSMYSEGCSYEEIAIRLNLKNETYARRKKYMSKEALLEIVKEDPEYQEYLRLQK